MKISELKKILESFNADAEIVIYEDSTDRVFEINCIDIDENETEQHDEKVVIFI